MKDPEQFLERVISEQAEPTNLGGCSGRHQILYTPHTLTARAAEKSLSRKHKRHRHTKELGIPEIALGRTGTAGLCQRVGNAHPAPRRGAQSVRLEHCFPATSGQLLQEGFV